MWLVILRKVSYGEASKIGKEMHQLTGDVTRKYKHVPDKMIVVELLVNRASI